MNGKIDPTNLNWLHDDTPTEELSASEKDAASVLGQVPFFPDPDTVEGEIELTRRNLRNWLAWVRAGRPKAKAFDPVLHPRGPDGKFIERPYDIPDSIWDTVADLDGGNALYGLMRSGELTPDSLDTLLQDPNIRIDDVPDDINTNDELFNQIDRGETDFVRPGAGDVDPDDDAFDDFEQKSGPDGGFGELKMGDVVQVTEDDGTMKTATVEDIRQSGQGIRLRYPDGTTKNMDSTPSGDDITGVLNVDKAIDAPDTDGDVGGDDVFPGIADVDVDDSRFKIASRSDVSPGDLVKYVEDGQEKIGEVEATRYSGAEQAVRTPDGDLVNFDINSDANITEAIQQTDPLFTTDLEDPEGGDWNTGTVMSSSGDIIRFRDDNGDQQVARIIDSGFDSGTVVTRDGEVTNVDSGDITGVFEPGSELSDTDFVTEPSRDTVDLLSLDGTPAERRAQANVDRGQFLSDTPLREADVEDETIPEGAFIARESGNSMTVGRVTGYSEDYRDRSVLEFKNSKGRSQTVRASNIESRGWKPYEPRNEPTVDLELEDGQDWDSDDTPRAAKSRAIRDALDQVLPKHPDAPLTGSDDSLPINDETFEKAKENIAAELAKARNQEHAENVIGAMAAVGDDKARASASPDVTQIEGNRGRFQVSDDESHDTIVHELGHLIGYTYGYTGGSNDRDGDTYPMPSFKWRADDVFDKYAMKAKPGSDQYEPDLPPWEQPGYQAEDWTDEVDAQVGKGLDGRNFTKVDYNDRINQEERLDDLFGGGMVRLSDPGSYNGPQNFAVRGFEADPESSTVSGVGRVELEDRDGVVHEANVSMRLNGDVAIKWRDDDELYKRATVTGNRKSVPDNWKEDPPDADEILGTQDISDTTEAFDNLADKVNKAWYRQAAASRELGERPAKKYSIISGYSAKQGHETMSRIHEVMRTKGQSTSEIVNNAQTLLKYHPDLLEAYQQVYDMPVQMKQALNQVALREDIGYRFEAPRPASIGDDKNPVIKAVRGLYGEDGGDD